MPNLEYPNVEGGLMVRLAKLEPSLVRGAIIAVFGLLGASGVAWATDDNSTIVVNFVLALLPLIAGVFIRGAVTPNVKTAAERAESGGYEAGEAAPYPEGTKVDVVPENLDE